MLKTTIRNQIIYTKVQTLIRRCVGDPAPGLGLHFLHMSEGQFSHDAGHIQGWHARKTSAIARKHDINIRICVKEMTMFDATEQTLALERRRQVCYCIACISGIMFTRAEDDIHTCPQFKYDKKIICFGSHMTLDSNICIAKLINSSAKK